MTYTAVTPVSDLHVGDSLPLPATPRHDARTVEVAILRPMPRSGRIRVWVRNPAVQSTLVTPWSLGAFFPDATFDKVVPDEEPEGDGEGGQ